MSNQATIAYYSRVKQVRDSIQKLYDDGKLPLQTPEPVIRTTVDPYTGITTTQKVVDAVFIVSRFGYAVAQGYIGGVASLVRPALAAEKVVVGSHELCLRDNPSHVRFISAYENHMRDQATFHAAADAKRGQRLNVGAIQVPGE